MANNNVWSFQQLTKKDPKFLELVGYNAPFGRPRQKPVAKEVIKSRVQTTNYPGRSGRPTRHSFGINWEPMELTGRWMTRMMPGAETANSTADDWRVFMADEVACRISWGHIVSYIGYIEELELGRESEDQIAWRMKILVDSNEGTDNQTVRVPAQQSMFDDFNDVINILKRSNLLKIPTLPNLNTDFLEQLDTFARALNGPSAALNKLVGRLEDIEKATFATLGHIRSAIKGFEIAFVDLRNLVMDTQIDAGNFARTAVSDIEWIQFQMDLDLHGNDIMALMAAMDRKAELAQRQQFTKVIKARQTPIFTVPGDDREDSLLYRGESWESLSIRATGSALNAGKIRAANGGGGYAVAGETYIVP